MDDDAIRAIRAQIAQAERLALAIADTVTRNKLTKYADELRKQLVEESSRPAEDRCDSAIC